MTRKPIERPTPEAIQAALSFIPSDDRQLWLKIGMGIKHEFDEAGFDLFDSWSQSGSNYDAAAVKTSWRSFKAGGKVVSARCCMRQNNAGLISKTMHRQRLSVRNRRPAWRRKEPPS
jgi:putative DNA primase/helicase